MNRGDIYWINLEPSTPPEMGKVRPGLIISNTAANSELDSVVIIPISSKTPEIWPFRISVDHGKIKKSFAVIPGIRQVSKSRLQTKIGQLSELAIEKIISGLTVYLSE